MITLECAWCDGDVTMDSLEQTTIDCPDCRVSVEIAPDPDAAIALAA
jgi:hypothetical protein